MEFCFLQMLKWYDIILEYYLFIFPMGFFDMGGTSSAPVASTTTTEPVSTDAAISFDSSDVLMIDDSNVISFDTNEGITSLPNTA